MTHKRHKARGVTLLEMLIALAVMAMLALTLASSYSAAGRFLARSTVMGQKAEAALARETLRRVTEAALTAPFPGKPARLWEGDGKHLRFVTEAEGEGFWPGEPVIATLGAGPSGAWQLSLTGRGERHEAPLQRDWRLAPPELGFTLRYFGVRQVGAEPQWHDAWAADDGLPRLVKLIPEHSISKAAALGDLPPPLILRPAYRRLQSERSLSSLVPPATPSRP